MSEDSVTLHAQISLDGIYYNIVWRVNREINIHEPAPGGYWCLLTLWPIDGRVLLPGGPFAIIIAYTIRIYLSIYMKSTRYYIIFYVYLSFVIILCFMMYTGQRDCIDAAAVCVSARGSVAGVLWSSDALLLGDRCETTRKTDERFSIFEGYL